MKNKRIVILIIIIIVIFSVGSIKFLGFSFSSNYYNTTIEAYNNENDEYEVKEEIALVHKDDVAVALCKTTTEEYIITPFRIKDGQYFSLSDVVVLSDLELEEIEGDIGESFCQIFGKKVYYNLIEIENAENFKKQYQNISFSEQIKTNDGKTLTLILYCK